jgi:hypothetical protein
VLSSGDLSRVYIEDDDRLLAFDRVVRSYEGGSYALQSSAVEAFGQWPAFPANVPKPTTPDGSPNFREDGTDEYGTTVYRPVSSTTGHGIAIGPRPGPVDPLAGAPDWSWWEPIR